MNSTDHHEVDADEPMPDWVELPRCGFSVFASYSATYEDDCGEPATWKLTFDGGGSWLHLCDKHAREVEGSNGKSG